MESRGLLHNFNAKQGERRQYRRFLLQYAVWWLKDRKLENPVAGLGTEISAGGLQFMLQAQIPQTDCTVVLEVNGRRMRANIALVQTAEVAYKGQAWKQYSAKFVGLLNADFDFILALTDKLTADPATKLQSAQDVQPVEAPFVPIEPVQVVRPVQTAQPAQPDSVPPSSDSRQAANGDASTDEGASQYVQFGKLVPRVAKHLKSKRSLSVGALASFDMLPSSVQEEIVVKLVDMKRMMPRQSGTPAMAPHYAGTQLAEDGSRFHRFFIRTRMSSAADPVVWNTEILISDDATILLVRT